MSRIASIILSTALAVTLVACASGNRAGAPERGTIREGVQKVSLTPQQAQAVRNGVKQMVEAKGDVKISAVTATQKPEKPGIHVCGFVAEPGSGGKQGEDKPFYIELREADGKPVAERGQVGNDPSRLSKVRFMCRLNG